MNPSSIERIDYFDTISLVIDFELLGYMALHQEDGVKTLTISFMNANSTSELIEAVDADENGAVLTKLYLDLYTKWKNYRANSIKTGMMIGGDF